MRVLQKSGRRAAPSGRKLEDIADGWPVNGNGHTGRVSRMVKGNKEDPVFKPWDTRSHWKYGYDTDDLSTYKDANENSKDKYELRMLNGRQSQMEKKDEVEKKEENKESWRYLLYKFTQETTFHGVRYITDETPYFLRRLIWVLIVLSATIVFTWFITDRLIKLLKHPRSVDVEVIFASNITFPSVTICNQNFFRKTAAHHYGLHDTIVTGYRNLDGKNRKQPTDIYEETIDDGFDLTPDHSLDGVGKSYARYVNITAEVCKSVCINVVSDSCCSLYYDKRKRTCFITAVDSSMTGVSLVEKQGFDYFRRKKCKVRKSANCNFDDSVCNFVVDFTKTLQWKRYRGDSGGGPSNKRPTFDHTKFSKMGWYLHTHTEYRSTEALAQLLSPFFLSENNTCITFYYQIRSGTLSVKIGVQDSLETVWSRGSSMSTDWERAYASLRNGYYRVILEASSKSRNGATEKVDIDIDDITIGECPKIPECRKTPMALGYSGSHNKGRSGASCARWSDVPDKLRPASWAFGNTSSGGVYNLRPEANFCRNPDNDPKGLWCFTNSKTFSMEYCDVPFCPCNATKEFTCKSQRCIPLQQVCDSINDCGDGSDEVDCQRGPSINCTFEDSWNCSYIKPKEAKYGWDFYKGRTGDVHWQAITQTVQGPARSGDLATVLAPILTVDDVACLLVDVQVSPTDVINIMTKSSVDSVLKEQVCSVTGGRQDMTNLEWFTMKVPLPNGTYHIMFEATLNSGRLAKASIDNVTVLFENCSSIIEEMTTWNPVTTEGFTTVGDVTTEEEVTTVPVVTTEETTTVDDITTVAITTPSPLENYTADNITDTDNFTIEDYNSTEGIMPTSELSTTFMPYDTALDVTTDIYNENDTYTNETFTTEMPEPTTIGYDFVAECLAGPDACSSCIRELRLPGDNGTEAECLEDNGIECFFIGPCKCGYRYSFVNTGWMFDQRTANRALDNETMSYMDNPDLYLEPVPTGTPTQGEWIRLMSPVITFRADTCLTFLYFTRYMNIRLFSYNTTSKQSIFDITFDGQKNSWHMAYVDLFLRGNYGLLWEFQYERFVEDNAGIDNITLVSGSCADVTYSASPSVNCSFDDDFWCGYKDVSLTSRNWLRSQEIDSYYVRTRSTTVGKLIRSLLSPSFSISVPSCVSFMYFGQGRGRGEMKTIAVTQVGKTAATTKTIWTMHSIIDNIWHYGKANMAPGTYQLRFDINGDDFRGGFDNILVTPGACSPINCTSKEDISCTSVLACYPDTYRCDGVSNCPGSEDEISTVCQKEDTGSSGKDKPTTETAENGASEPADVVDIGDPVTNLTEMYYKLGHQAEDFIYKCEWDGQNCDQMNFTSLPTDYGLCYTFNNAEMREFSTKKTGARFGLRLTLNIEQYEYMIGPNTDAGIKVFLHSTKELPQVRDLGFAISPGLHALVGIMRNDAVNLEPPWGDCDKVNLTYFDDYMYSWCTVDCETELLTNSCSCRDAYMPIKPNSEEPPICNFTEYFECAVVTLRNISGTFITRHPNDENADTGQIDGTFYDDKLGQENKKAKCSHDCPKPCNQTVYEPALSYALLSSMSVDQILDTESTELQAKYDRALETRQRTDGDIFWKDLEILTLLSRHYQDVTRLDKEYRTAEYAILTNIAAAVKEIMTTVLVSDLLTMFSFLQEYIATYDQIYSDTTSLLSTYTETFSLTLKEVEQLLFLTVKSGSIHSKLASVASKGADLDRFLSETLDIINERYQNTSSAVAGNKDLLANLPLTFYKDPMQCQQHISNLRKSLNSLATLFEDIIDITRRSRYISRLQDVRLQLKEYMSVYTLSSQKVLACLKEYRGELEHTWQWGLDIRNDINRSDSVYKLDIDSVSEIAKDVMTHSALVAAEMSKYETDRTTKLAMLQEVLGDNNNRNPATVITTFSDRTRTRVSEPLRALCDKTRSEILAYYDTALKHAADLSYYFKPHFFYNKAELMRIWKKPIANLEAPDQLTYEGREIWQIWPRETPIAEFVAPPKRAAISYVEDALKSYFGPMIHDINTFEEQLVTRENNLLQSLEKVNSKYREYKISRQIDHTFVSNNFLNMDVYFKQLKYQKVEQIKAYELTQFLSDVGGFLGLLLGASVLTIFELLDLIVYNVIKKYLIPSTPRSRTYTSQSVETNMNSANVDKTAYWGGYEANTQGHAI